MSPKMKDNEGRIILKPCPFCGRCSGSGKEPSTYEERRETEIEQLKEENTKLSSWQCPYLDGKTGLTSDDHGHQFCIKDAEIKRLREAIASIVMWADTAMRSSGDLERSVSIGQAATIAHKALEEKP